MHDNLPVIDVRARRQSDEHAARRAALEIGEACKSLGFFYAIGHGIADETLAGLDAASRRFFALPLERKMQIEMARGGRAWRGFFPVGGELTSGKPDIKEGLYFGEELGREDPRVAAGWPLHGANLFPGDVSELKPLVHRFMKEAEVSAQAILEGIALSLGLERRYFRKMYTAQPTMLFRIFHYPAAEPEAGWGVGEHTDYGLLTLLAQDEHGGLEVKTPNGWINAPPIPGALVCNIGDMLDRLTGGLYRSTPHRVLNRSGKSRLSFPFFFDPGFKAHIEPLPGFERAAGSDRWDGLDLASIEGAYGDYLLGKVSKVFPELATGVANYGT